MKKLILKLSFLLVIIIILQMSLTYYNFQYESPGTVRKLKKYLNNNTDIIYFGDSTIGWTSIKDTNKQSIAEMLNNLYTSFSLGTVDHNAYHMDIYSHFVKFIMNRNHPKIIIIPINIATFSPSIDMRPSFQFELEKIFLKHYDNYFFRVFFKTLLVFKAFNIRTISDDEFMNTLVFNGDKPIGTIKDIEFIIHEGASEKQRMKNFIIYHYMISLTEDHRKVRSMIEIVRMIKKSNIKLIFYLTPINYQICEKYLGEDFRLRLKSNIDIIKSLLTENGIEVLDLTFDLQPESFCWIDDGCLNEHLNQKGRKYTATRLYETIKDL